MTMIEQWNEISTKIKQLRTQLLNLLILYDADINDQMTFEELCWAVESIPGKIYPSEINKKPYRKIICDANDNIIRKDMYVYQKIRYYQAILSYALIYKGVDEQEVQQANTLSELIVLINNIEKYHQSHLTIVSYDDTFYYNTYSTVSYILVDENGNDITEGQIIVKQNDIIIESIYAGQPLAILPMIGDREATYEIYYEGNDGYKESNHESITVNIKATKLSLSMNIINNNLSERDDGITSNDTFFDTDIMTITVKATNLLAHNAPAGQVPIIVKMPDKNNTYHVIHQGITNVNGEFTCQASPTVHNSDLEHIYVHATSNIVDETNISNATVYQEIFVKWSPLSIKDYKFYDETLQKNIQIYYRNIDTGELTSEYAGDITRVYDNNGAYTNIIISDGVNYSNYECTKDELGTYTYTYKLYQNNRVYYMITNKVKIAPSVEMVLYVPDKFLQDSDETLECLIEILNYDDNPHVLSDGIYLCDTLRWSCTTFAPIYQITGAITTIQLPIDDILDICNGFLLQAISVNDRDTYSNIVYVRNHISTPLDTEIILDETQEDYTLGDSHITVHGQLLDEEGNPVIQSVSVRIKINSEVQNTYTLTPNHNGVFTRNINIEQAWISEDIEIECSYGGETDFFNPSSNNTIITYTKANVNYWSIEGIGTVYQYCDNVITIGLEEDSIYNQYISGTITYEGHEVVLSSNVFNTRVLPTLAGEYALLIHYSGNQYYNSKDKTIYLPIDKTTDYIFDVAFNDKITAKKPMTLTPSLIDGSSSIAPHTYTGSIQYVFHESHDIKITNIEPSTYTPMEMGNQTVTITYSGDNNHEACIINKSFIVDKTLIETYLSIDVPLILIYSDDFNINGVLTDEENNTLSGKTIKLKVGNTIVDTTTTDNNGAYSFTHTPVSTGNHSFQTIFEGDDDYYDSTSSVVNRVIDKETTILSVTSPLNSAHFYNDDIININGTLLSDDGESLDSQDIVISADNTILKTLTTDSTGAFTGTVTNLPAGTHTLKFEFAGDTNYANSYVDREVIIEEHVYDLTLTCNTPVIMIDDIATITATLSKDNTAYPEQTLTYEIKHGDTVIDSGSEVTDLDGQIQINYTGTNAGYIEIIITYTHTPTLLEKTYVIKDLYYLDTATVDNRSNYNISHMNIPVSYDSTEKYYYITNNGGTGAYHNYLIINGLDVFLGVEISIDINTSQLPDPENVYEVVGGVGLYNETEHGVIATDGKTYRRGYMRQATTNLASETNIDAVPTIQFSHETWYTIKYQIKNDKLTVYIYQGDTLITSEELNNTYITSNFNQALLYFVVYSGVVRFKNIEIKGV